MKISAVINTLNSEKDLETCLSSVSFVDEILVVDMHSADATVSIAKRFGARVEQIDQELPVELVRNKSVALAKHDWVLLLDPDEIVAEGLQAKITSLSSHDWNACSAFRLPRKNLIFDHWMQHSGWWPDYQVRLFKKSAVRWSGKIHEQPTVSGKVQDFSANPDIAISHSNYNSFTEYFEKFQRYTDSEAMSLVETSVSADTILTTFFEEFFRRYYAQLGWKDGLHGTSLTFLQSFYQITVQLKMWEKTGFNKQTTAISSGVIWKILSDWRYWEADRQMRLNTGFSRFYWRLRKKLRL